MIDVSIFSGTNFRAGPPDHCPGLLSARQFYWQLVRLRTGIPSKATHEYTPRQFLQTRFISIRELCSENLNPSE